MSQPINAQPKTFTYENVKYATPAELDLAISRALLTLQHAELAHESFAVTSPWMDHLLIVTNEMRRRLDEAACTRCAGFGTRPADNSQPCVKCGGTGRSGH